MSGKSYQPTETGTRPDDRSRTDAAMDLDSEDPFDDEAVTSVLDAAWDDRTS